MAKFIKSFKKSKIMVYAGISDSVVDSINSLGNIISIDNLNGVIVVEYIDDDDVWTQYAGSNNDTATTTTSVIPKDVADALDTVVNTDPFRLGASGLKLREIYKTLPGWVDIARKKLKNEFILRRIKTIDVYIESQKKPIEVKNEDIFD